VEIGEVDGSVGAHDHVVRPAESLALEAVGEHRDRSVWLEALQRTIAMGAEQEPPFRIEGKPVRSQQDQFQPSVVELQGIALPRTRVPAALDEH